MQSMVLQTTYSTSLVRMSGHQKHHNTLVRV